MAFLPERHSERFGDDRPIAHHVERPMWHPMRRQSSGLGTLLFVAAVGLGAGYLVRTGYEPAPTPRPATVDRPQRKTAAAPPTAQREATAPTRCSDADGTIHGWQGNGTGITPTDYFHFLPRCDGGRR